MHHWAGTAAFNSGFPVLSGNEAATVCILFYWQLRERLHKFPSRDGFHVQWRVLLHRAPFFMAQFRSTPVPICFSGLNRCSRNPTLASALVVLIGLATAIHGTIVGRASADAKTSLAYASLTQVGMVFVEIGIGWTSIAVAHILGHATVRTMQFLRAPSMLHDYHQMHSAIGGEILPTGKHLEDLFPEGVHLWLYRWAFDRGHLDTILDRWVIYPLLEVSRVFAKLDHIGLPRTWRRGDFGTRSCPAEGIDGSA